MVGPAAIAESAATLGRGAPSPGASRRAAIAVTVRDIDLDATRSPPTLPGTATPNVAKSTSTGLDAGEDEMSETAHPALR